MTAKVPPIIRGVIRQYGPIVIFIYAIFIIIQAYTTTLDLARIANYFAIAIAGMIVYIVNFAADVADLKTLSIDLVGANVFLKNQTEQNTKKSGEIVENISRINKTQTEIIIKSDRFYKLLHELRDKAEISVKLVNLSPLPPAAYMDATISQYIDSTIKFAHDHPSITVKRILSIPTTEKLDWVKKTIEESRNLNNLHLAYIKLEKVGESEPFIKILNMQIIDEIHMLLLAPQYAYMPQIFPKSLYIKDGEAVKIFNEYYEEIWNFLRKQKPESDNGFILKEGPIIYDYDRKIRIIEEQIIKDNGGCK